MRVVLGHVLIPERPVTSEELNCSEGLVWKLLCESRHEQTGFAWEGRGRQTDKECKVACACRTKHLRNGSSFLLAKSTDPGADESVATGCASSVGTKTSD